MKTQCYLHNKKENWTLLYSWELYGLQSRRLALVPPLLRGDIIQGDNVSGIGKQNYLLIHNLLILPSINFNSRAIEAKPIPQET